MVMGHSRVTVRFLKPEVLNPLVKPQHDTGRKGCSENISVLVKAGVSQLEE